MYFSTRLKIKPPSGQKRTGHNEYTYFNKDFIENINKLKLYKNRKLQPLDNGGHKMTAVSKEIQPLDNGGHKMTAVSKEFSLLTTVVNDRGFKGDFKNISLENFQSYGFLVN